MSYNLSFLKYFHGENESPFGETSPENNDTSFWNMEKQFIAICMRENLPQSDIPREYERYIINACKRIADWQQSANWQSIYKQWESGPHI